MSHPAASGPAPAPSPTPVATVASASASVPGAAAQANPRSARDFRTARRHSGLVKMMKFILPTCAFLIVGAFGTMSAMNFVPGIKNIEGTIGLENGQLVMDKPKMAGFDKNERAYEVQAQKAIQDLAKPGIVELKSIDATVPMGTSAFADVVAGSGTYDTRNEKLNLRDQVEVQGARGMNIRLEEADIDMKTGTLISSKPVFVDTEDAKVTADSVTVLEEGKRILFKNRVKMTITRTPKPQASQ
ncbi:MAG: LPS export ABC transporter periplasmic protein LptC [Pseudomonadota bacterium]